MSQPRPAPPIEADQWLNSDSLLSLEAFRGRVLLIEAFQMLCPGCVAHGLPQAKWVLDTFPQSDVAVIGLHSVFEHHDAQNPSALAAFLHEYRINFPVAVDARDPAGFLPRTMAAYGMQGTPTLVLIDRQGRRRAQHFGQVSDLRLGAEIQTLIDESGRAENDSDAREAGTEADGCTEEGCPAPGPHVQPS